MTGQKDAGVVDKQLVDVDNVTGDTGIIRALAQRHQGAGDDVNEAPRELAEGGGVAFGGKLPGDAAGNLRDAAKASDGVVAGRNLRPAQMKQPEDAFPPGAVRLRPDSTQQVGITHRVATANILGNQQLRQPGFADAGGAEHQCMPRSVAQWQRDVAFVQLHAVQQWIAAAGGRTVCP